MMMMKIRMMRKKIMKIIVMTKKTRRMRRMKNCLKRKHKRNPNMMLQLKLSLTRPMLLEKLMMIPTESSGMSSVRS